MPLSEFIRVNDIGWEVIIWMTCWIIGILIVICAIVLTSTWAAAVNHFIKKIMPDYYNGKLRIALQKLKEITSEDVLLKRRNQNLEDRLAVMESTWEGLKK